MYNLDKCVNECKFRIERIINSKPRFVERFSVVSEITLAAYLLAEASNYNDPFSVKFEEMNVDKDIVKLASDRDIDGVWDELLELLKDYSREVFEEIAKSQDDAIASATPESLIKLSKKLLDVKNNEKCADLCAGTGSFAFSLINDNPQVSVEAYDINEDAVTMVRIRNEYLENKVSFVCADAFSLVMNNNFEVTYDKIFANYPFGMRLRDLGIGKDYLDKLEKRIPSMSKATSSDWLYNILMTDILSESGKAIGIMTNGSTWNMIDAPIRKYFVENGLIEAVIALPAKLFANTTIPTSLILLSHNNESVRLIDAVNLFQAGRRVNELSDSDIETILEAVEQDSDISMSISKDILRDNEYVLSCNRYAHKEIYIENGVAFEEVIKRITRGAPLNAKELDLLATSVPTDMQYLMISNIKNGLIDKDLPYLSEIAPKNEKYCLSNHCIILSKNGYPYKVAVAEIDESKKILANGNLYIIEIDETKADPYYLAAFFSSEMGISALKSITVGATIPNIGVDQLKKLIVPLPSLEEQKSLAEEYRQLKDELILLQLKFEKAQNRMMHLFDEGGI